MLDHNVLIDDGSDSTVKLNSWRFSKKWKWQNCNWKKKKLELEKAMKQQELDARLQMEKEKFELEKELKQKELNAKIKP